MIRCRPLGICSWNFTLEGEGHRARLEYCWFRETGRAIIDDLVHEIHKGGALSGRWTLEHRGKTLVTAQKKSAMTRTFRITGPLGALTLRSESPFTRSFQLERGGLLLATITPDHMFTRRASIQTLERNLHFPTLAFSFWLIVLLWRRATHAAGSS